MPNRKARKLSSATWPTFGLGTSWMRTSFIFGRYSYRKSPVQTYCSQLFWSAVLVMPSLARFGFRYFASPLNTSVRSVVPSFSDRVRATASELMSVMAFSRRSRWASRRLLAVSSCGSGAGTAGAPGRAGAAPEGGAAPVGGAAGGAPVRGAAAGGAPPVGGCWAHSAGPAARKVARVQAVVRIEISVGKRLRAAQG